MADRDNSVNSLKSIVGQRGGFAKPNHYKIFMPTIFGEIDSRTLNTLCLRTQVPGRQIMTNERRVGLETAKVAYGYANTEVQMAFRETAQYDVYNYFARWQELGVNTQTNQIGYLRSWNSPGYGKSVKIFQLDKNDQELYKVELMEAFPTTLSTIELNAAEDSLVVEVNVALSFTKWKKI